MQAQGETLWDEQFTATDDANLNALVASIETEIDAGETLPMFDERGNFIEHSRTTKASRK